MSAPILASSSLPRQREKVREPNFYSRVQRSAVLRISHVISDSEYRCVEWFVQENIRETRNNSSQRFPSPPPALTDVPTSFIAVLRLPRVVNDMCVRAIAFPGKHYRNTQLRQ